MKRARSQAQAADVRSLAQRLQPVASAQIGRLVGVTPEGRPLVEFNGSRQNTAAVTTVSAPRSVLEAAAARGQEVVLLFENGNPARPILVGFVTAIPPEPQRGSLGLIVDEVPEVAQVDGKRVCIEGKDEIVLRCGEASITLRRNGRLVIKGAYVESHSKGTNRIKGGSVQIN